tara:strand:+ start:442 stop:1065 length:624 start_codon:yes stop_codon:yes gene_type:complete
MASEFQQTWVNYINNVGKKKATKTLLKSFRNPFIKFAKELTEFRQTQYDSMFSISTNIVEMRVAKSDRYSDFYGYSEGQSYPYYRSESHTMRTKKRTTYTRGSQFGGTKIEKVTSIKPGQMSQKTRESLVCAYNPKTGILSVPIIKEDEKKHSVFEKDKEIIIDVLTSDILKHFKTGLIPSDMDIRFEKAQREAAENLFKRIKREGY